MRKLFARLTLIAIIIVLAGCEGVEPTLQPANSVSIVLPLPAYESETSIEQALLERRSMREYRAEPLTLPEISQLLWAAQGVTHPNGYRTAPSAGGLYPLEIFLVAGEVAGIEPGVYHYMPKEHQLRLVLENDQRQQLSSSALNQPALRDAPAVIVITAVYERTTAKYRDRGVQYVHIEVGCASENIYLQAVSLELGTVFIGAFRDDEVSEVLQLAANEHPLGLMPVGRKQAP